MQTFVLTQRLAKLQEAKKLREQMDAVAQGSSAEGVTKFLVITRNIEGELATLKEMQQKLQANSTREVTEKTEEDVKQVET